MENAVSYTHLDELVFHLFRLPVTGDERDEVDRLRGTINRMAEGLEETEKMKNEFISSVSHRIFV